MPSDHDRDWTDAAPRLFALLLAVTMGQGFGTLVIAISLLLWASFARIIRGEVLALKQRDFVALAKVRGCSTPRIMLTHILPNVLNTFMVLVTLNPEEIHRSALDRVTAGLAVGGAVAVGAVVHAVVHALLTLWLPAAAQAAFSMPSARSRRTAFAASDT